jgi:RimJ/RimL family protein N-acetyltransferase
MRLFNLRELARSGLKSMVRSDPGFEGYTGSFLMDTFDGIHPIAIPKRLSWGEVSLIFSEFVEANEALGLAPRYVFKILDRAETPVGYITFRIGDSWHVQFAAGHIGYRVDREFQGHGYAYQACRAIAPFVRTHYARVILTTNLTNQASMRTIERLGAEFLGLVDIPEDDPAFASGEAQRRRYVWELDESGSTRPLG